MVVQAISEQSRTYLLTLLPKPQRLDTVTWLHSVRQRVPQGLTVCRGLLGFTMIWCLLGPEKPGYLEAALFCALAGLTDAVDGPLARRWNTVSLRWAVGDLLADKMAILLPLWALTWRGIVPDWITWVVVGREIVVAGLRWKLVKQQPLLPDRLGKVKTLVFFLALVWVFIFSHLAVSEALQHGLPWSLLMPLKACTRWVLWLALGLTVVSGLNYLWRVISPLVRSPGHLFPLHRA